MWEETCKKYIEEKEVDEVQGNSMPIQADTFSTVCIYAHTYLHRHICAYEPRTYADTKDMVVPHIYGEVVRAYAQVVQMLSKHANTKMVQKSRLHAHTQGLCTRARTDASSKMLQQLIILTNTAKLYARAHRWYPMLTKHASTNILTKFPKTTRTYTINARKTCKYQDINQSPLKLHVHTRGDCTRVHTQVVQMSTELARYKILQKP